MYVCIIPYEIHVNNVYWPSRSANLYITCKRLHAIWVMYLRERTLIKMLSDHNTTYTPRPHLLLDWAGAIHIPWGKLHLHRVERTTSYPANLTLCGNYNNVQSGCTCICCRVYTMRIDGSELLIRLFRPEFYMALSKYDIINDIRYTVGIKSHGRLRDISAQSILDFESSIIHCEVTVEVDVSRPTVRSIYHRQLPAGCVIHAVRDATASINTTASALTRWRYSPAVISLIDNNIGAVFAYMLSPTIDSIKHFGQQFVDICNQ
jgi:hypothetical protein